MNGKKVLLSILLALAGLVVFVLGSPYYRVFPTNWNQTFYIGLAVFFLILAIIFNQVQSLSKYSMAVFAFFIASAALVFLKTGWVNLPENSTDALQNLAVDKLSQFLHIVPVILVLTFIAGDNLKSLFIQKGNLKRGLRFGLISFAAFAVVFVVMVRNNNDFFPSLGRAIPWVLLFIFANSIMEELWFRGIFLKKFEPLIGRMAAILVTSLVFGASHINATYTFPGGPVVFGLVVFGLGVAGAYAMYKDDSLIGPVLFHAGYDLMIIGSVLESL